MTTLTCPKCRQGITDDALDAGQCPGCGFPLDGPVVIASGPRNHTGKRLLIAAGFVASFAAGAATDFFFHQQKPQPQLQAEAEPEPQSELAAALPAPAAPIPPQSKQPTPANPTAKDDKEPASPSPMPVAVEVPKKEPRPLGVVMKVNPKIAAVRNFDHPDDTAAIPDLRTNDHVVLTGRVRMLRIGSVNGQGSLDASGLIAEEIIVTGDLSSKAVVKLNSPNGKVTINGFVFDSAQVAITAPGGEVVLAKSSHASGGTILTITAKRLEANGPLSRSAQVNLTLTAGGSIKFTQMEEFASIGYQKSAPTDPAPNIEFGQLHGSAKVFEMK